MLLGGVMPLKEVAIEILDSSRLLPFCSNSHPETLSVVS